jgi:ferrochelatase
MPEAQPETIGVVLLNLGGPERLEDVEPFLYNLFSDRQIIRLGPKFLQKPLARFISHRRAPKSRDCYRQIGGGSPLARLTAQQAAALETALAGHGRFLVKVAMRYWAPFAREILASFAAEGIHQLVALTLYPHYSVATTGSSLDDLHQAAAAMPEQFTIIDIPSWPTQTDYIRCLADNISAGHKAMGDDAAQVVYSAHSLPVSFINAGDPYLEQLHETIVALEKLTGLAGRLCFQSRSGPVRWLAPSTPEMLAELAGQGVKAVLMVPISFVSDHVETLYEIDIQYRQLAADLGLTMARTASLNDKPLFIAGLRELVLAACRQHHLIDAA